MLGCRMHNFRVCSNYLYIYLFHSFITDEAMKTTRLMCGNGKIGCKPTGISPAKMINCYCDKENCNTGATINTKNHLFVVFFICTMLLVGSKFNQIMKYPLNCLWTVVRYFLFQNMKIINWSKWNKLFFSLSGLNGFGLEWSHVTTKRFLRAFNAKFMTTRFFFHVEISGKIQILTCWNRE